MKIYSRRCIQALGGCVVSVASMAMVRDFFPVEKSAVVISFLVLILGASPLLAPTVGSFIVGWWGWHFVFIILAAITFIILALVFFFFCCFPVVSLLPFDSITAMAIAMASTTLIALGFLLSGKNALSQAPA